MNRWEQEISKYSLEEEKEILERLREIYEQSGEDVQQKISELATLISENPENLQSLIYQKRYQEVIKEQIDAALNGLDGVTYETIHKYLEDCYRTGFVGSMYDFHHQGIPLVVPIQQKDVVRALTVDSKLSKGLYTRLGEDVNKLKKVVQVEVSRGIAQGLYWNDIAKNLSVQMINSPVKTAMNNSMRIARTEGHRVQVQGQLDACQEAKDKGADVVKQWDSTLDERTRDTHRELHGQIREYNENFVIPSTKQEAFAPSMFGIAEEDINCRCALLQRARWMLDEDELKFLEDSARQLGLVDEAGNVTSNSFSEFKEKYLNVVDYYKLAETIRISKKDNSNAFSVNRNLINSKSFHDKFEGLTSSKMTNESIYQHAMKILEHRDGTDFEDIVVIGARTGEFVVENINAKISKKISLTEEQFKTVMGYNGDVILIHNHPDGYRLSYTDIKTMFEHTNIEMVIAVGHDGSVHSASEPDRNYDIESFWNLSYNEYIQLFDNKEYAKIKATDDLYRAKIFKTETR